MNIKLLTEQTVKLLEHYEASLLEFSELDTKRKELLDNITAMNERSKALDERERKLNKSKADFEKESKDLLELRLANTKKEKQLAENMRLFEVEKKEFYEMKEKEEQILETKKNEIEDFIKTESEDIKREKDLVAKNLTIDKDRKMALLAKERALEAREQRATRFNQIVNINE